MEDFILDLFQREVERQTKFALISFADLERALKKARIGLAALTSSTRRNTI